MVHNLKIGMELSETDKNIIVLTNLNFLKIYGAAETRLLEYCRALSASGCSVFLTSVNGYEQVQYENRSFPGVFFPDKADQGGGKYFFQQFAFRNYYLYLKNIFAFSKTLNGKVVFFYYSFTLAGTLLSLFYLKLLKKQVLFCEKNELQTGIALNQITIYTLRNILPTFLLKAILISSGILQDILSFFFDGIIVISTNLYNLYNPLKNNVLKVPVLSSVENFGLVSRNALRTNSIFSICYAGEISQKKDGLLDFIKALDMAQIDFVLDLYGNGHFRVKKKLNRLLSKFNFNDRVTFNEIVEQNQIAALLTTYDLLVLPRPSNLQTRYGFSTKLAEYMMSGVPVLASTVSDNEKFISDGITGYLCKPGSPRSISTKLLEISKVPQEKRKIVAENAKSLAIRVFDVLAYKAELMGFFFKRT